MHSRQVVDDQQWLEYYNAQFERWITDVENERREARLNILASSTPVIMGGTK